MPPEDAGGATPRVPGAAGAAPPPAPPPPLMVPMPFKLLLDEAMRWARRNLRVIYPPIAVPVAVLSGCLAAGQALWMGPDAALAGTDPWRSMARSCSFLVLALPVTLCMALLLAAMTVAAVDAVGGRGADVGRALRFVVRPGVLGTQLLVLLCVVAAAVCCVLPVFYVGPLLCMTVPAMAAEGVTGAAALRRSAELTRHNPGGRWLSSPIVKCLAIFVVTAIISYLVSMVLELPVMLVSVLAFVRKAAAGEDVRGLGASMLWWQVPLRCLAALVSTAVQLYSSFAIALFYFDLRARREGDDLRRAVAGMTGADLGPSSTAPLPP